MLSIYGREYKVLDFDEIKGKCFGFIYVTVNNITGKMYLGLHNTWRKNYIGSGNYMKAAIKKYGRENFTRYIIDTADSYKELVNLEAYYITEEFGIDLAKSDEWYNITSGLQRGGNTWAGMSEEDKAKRAEKVSKALKGRKQSKERIEQNRKATSKRMADPKEREKIAEATKAALADPEVRKRMSEGRKGTHYSEEGKESLSKALRSHYKVNFNGSVVCADLNAKGGYDGLAKALSNILGYQIGKKLFVKLVNSGEVYEGMKEELHGLQIERID